MKYLKNPFIILVITFILSWSIWITTSAFSYNSTLDDYIEHKTNSEHIYGNIDNNIKNLFNIMNNKFDDLGDKIDKNQEHTNDILLNLQKQIGDMKK